MRFWIVLLTVLLLAAPVGTVAEIADATSLHDDATIAHARATVVASVPARSPIVEDHDVMPACPETARIFRPPR